MSIKEFLGFKAKPRDAAATGIPLTQDDQIVLFWRNRTTQTTNIQIVASTFNPETGKARSFTVIGPLVTTTTTFAGETTQLSTTGMFSDGELLTSVIVTTAAVNDPTQFWSAIELFRKGRSVAWLCEGYTHSNHAVSWSAGFQGGKPQPSFVDAGVTPCQYTFQGTLTNAGNAGNHVLTITPATASRFRLISGTVTNGDASARTLTADITDGTNIIVPMMNANGAVGSISLAAGGVQAVPSDSGNSSGLIALSAHRAAGLWVAGGDRMLWTLASVADTKTTTFTGLFEVVGAQPTFALTGPALVVATTNTSRFEPG